MGCAQPLLLVSRVRVYAGSVSAFDEIYTPTEEHQAFRAAVREVCDEKVAPHAAEADELGEFPKASF
ncbi:MAG TPA: acyl-CoA dehydrogenase family protein, partial [Microlunatus sp.]|nr:acyl-CoA dehydrogenase family protein [Microlunatus sp.]